MAEFLLRRREDAERLERELAAAPAATLSTASRGRGRPEEPDPWRTAFERDRDRILHSKAFRRLKHKTQVFIDPEGDHFVTRLTHTLQVTQIGGAIARYLGLNAVLAEAIALGHDVGHSPFGHTGEEALAEIVPGGWLHSAQSVRIFEALEPLNLTWEVLDGIRAHSWRIEEPPATPEGAVIRYADRIAYLAHDALDALRAGVLRREDLPAEAIETFGEPGRDWVASMIEAVVVESHRTGRIEMDPGRLEVMHRLRAFMFDHVYLRADAAPRRRRAREIVRDLVSYYLDHPDEIPETYRHDDADLLTQVVDYVAGMTDRFAIRRHDERFRPRLF
ncbi:MAG TPA: HD domain-containing protein [Actinobacteria bacterium]|nr:HD domain-containing protein [Actinomycetota bacterium]